MWEKERERMVQSLERAGYIETPKVKEAFLNVSREKFLPPRVRDQAYDDRPLPIGQGQTISAPSMIAIMLEVLLPEVGDKIFEIGTGSGYNAALLAEMVGEDGTVYTMERLDSIAETGRRNLKELGYENVNVVVGDGTKGYEEESPWDGVLVTACAPEIPDPLIDQLNVGGMIAIPVGSYYMSQALVTVEKVSEKETKRERHGGCAFVPLVGEYGWDEDKAR